MLKKAGGYPVFLSNVLIERAAKIAARPSLLPGEKPSKNSVLRAAVRIGLDTLEKGNAAVLRDLSSKNIG